MFCIKKSVFNIIYLSFLEKDEDPSLLRQKLQNIKNWIASLECDIRKEGYRKTDMEKAKKIFDDATNTFEKKKEDREQVKRQLAGLLLDTGRSLKTRQPNFIIS